jgi:tetratricopeptide (TPR) repeat protein
MQPISVDAHVNLGNAYLQDKQYAESEKAFKAAAKLDPRNPLADYTLGHQYVQTERFAEAEAQFLKVQKVSPNDGNVYYSLGMLYNKQGKYDEAIANLEKALTLKKKFASANYELGVAYVNAGRIDDAKKQLSELSNLDFYLANDLKFVMDKPKMVAMATPPGGGFNGILGANTPIWALDPTLITPNSSRVLSVSISFSNEMDVSSITNVQNWSISRGNKPESGYYNNTMPVTTKEVSIFNTPQSVSYNPTTREATVSFRITQNASGTATIDPSHLVFSFAGKDAMGRDMDLKADEVDGFTITPF